jgi:hypothetical protein
VKSRPLNPIQTAEYLLTQHNLRRSPRWLQERRREGGGPSYVRVGNDIRYYTETIDRWVAAQFGRELANTTEYVERRERGARDNRVRGGSRT